MYRCRSDVTKVVLRSTQDLICRRGYTNTRRYYLSTYLPRSFERLMVLLMKRAKSSAACRHVLACAISEAGTAKLTSQLMHPILLLLPPPSAFRIISSIFPHTTATPLLFLSSQSAETRWQADYCVTSFTMSEFPESPQSETFTPSSPFRPPSILASTPKASGASVRESSAHADGHGGSTGASTPPRQHIALTEPPRPALPARLTATARGESHRSMSEALRLARSRQEQEELLDDEEQADDDGCYPPRKNDDPRVPNPHGWLPVYTSIHKIRRLIVASIGRFNPHISLFSLGCALVLRLISFSVCAGGSLRFFNRTCKGVPLILEGPCP